MDRSERNGEGSSHCLVETTPDLLERFLLSDRLGAPLGNPRNLQNRNGLPPARRERKNDHSIEVVLSARQHQEAQTGLMQLRRSKLPPGLQMPEQGWSTSRWARHCGHRVTGRQESKEAASEQGQCTKAEFEKAPSRRRGDG